jgi:hypothetical protein
MTIEYTTIFNSKVLQNLHNLDFWYENLPCAYPLCMNGYFELIYLFFSFKKSFLKLQPQVHE